MIARERIRQRNRWCRRRQIHSRHDLMPQPPKGWKINPGDDLGCRVCSCWLCDPHKSERKLRLLEKRRAEHLVQEELQAEAEIRSAWEADCVDGWPDDPRQERPKW